MAFLDQVTLATDGNFVSKVQQAMITSAIQIVAEKDSVDNHYDSMRLSYAVTVLKDPRRYAQLMSYGVATNGAINSQSSDNDIQFTVNSMWDAYAGVRPNNPLVDAAAVVPGGGGFSEESYRITPSVDSASIPSLGERIKKLWTG